MKSKGKRPRRVRKVPSRDTDSERQDDSNAEKPVDENHTQAQPSFLRQALHKAIKENDDVRQACQTLSHYSSMRKALYDYTARPGDSFELSFKKGDALQMVGGGGFWWVAQAGNGQMGLVPSNYFYQDRKIIETVEAMFDYASRYQDEAILCKGQIYRVVAKYGGWSWLATTAGDLRVPTNCLRILDRARALYDYVPSTSRLDDMTFSKGDILTVYDSNSSRERWAVTNEHGVWKAAPSSHLKVLKK